MMEYYLSCHVPLSGLTILFLWGLIKYYFSQKGKPILLPPKCKPDNINLNVKIYKSLLDWANYEASCLWPAGQCPFSQLEKAFPGYLCQCPALAPLNLHPQWIINPALDELAKHEGPPVFLLKSLKYLKRHGSKTWNMIIWQQACS